jgi:hypothetical protein
MTSPQANASPLRQRMTDDMRMRQLSPKTQDIYLRIVREFARFLGRSPDTATVEDLRRYQLHLVDHGTSPVSLNHAITGLKFFFEVTLDRPELMVRMHPVRVPRILPVVLSPDEVRRLIEASGNLKHQTALSVAYGAGLRASEVVALKAWKHSPTPTAAGDSSSLASTPRSLIPLSSPGGLRRFAHANGWCMQSARSRGRRRCSRTSHAIRTASRSPTSVWSHSTSMASPSAGRTIARAAAHATTR